MRRIAFALFLVIMTLPALAAEQAPERFAPDRLFGSLVREDDVTALFSYLRSAVIAASESREEAVPEELKQRAEALGAELKRRGTLAGLALLRELETHAKDLVGEFAPER
jgi:hypothetical protein